MAISYPRQGPPPPIPDDEEEFQQIFAREPWVRRLIPVSSGKLRELCARGEAPAPVRIGRGLFWVRAEVVAYVQKLRKNARWRFREFQ
jgi:hypothetical protein